MIDPEKSMTKAEKVLHNELLEKADRDIEQALVLAVKVIEIMRTRPGFDRRGAGSSK